MLGWIPRERAMASATALLGPWPDSSIRQLEAVHLRLALNGWICSSWHSAHHHHHNIRRGGHLRHQVPATGIAKHRNQTCFFCRAWVWGGPRLLPFFPWLQPCPSGGYTSWESPGKLAMVVRRKAATSKDWGHPCHQSRLMAFGLFVYILCYSLQYTFILPLEVVCPGRSLSTFLIATSYC